MPRRIFSSLQPALDTKHVCAKQECDGDPLLLFWPRHAGMPRKKQAFVQKIHRTTLEVTYPYSTV